ncbi:uncharacterized protein LOC135462007 [Liolophura sinensis]|uniref:uncharacterized protein LOC135462007 n=1 Tax=Liolophura sinensis TaxID=3198878 RepID=UPI00315974F1
MSALLYLTGLVALTGAVVPPEPKVICCEPGQYSGQIGVYTVTAAPGHATASSTSIGNFSMDFQNGRTYSKEYVFDNEFIVVQDFNKGLYWTVVNGNCTTYKLPNQHAQKCFLEDEYIPVPLTLADNIPVNVFREFNPQRPDLEISSVVRASDCVPLIETTNSRTGETTIVTTVLYLNLTMSVTDTSVFAVPANCPSEAIDVGSGNTGHGHGHSTIIG